MSLILNGSLGIQLPAAGDIKLYEDSGNGANYVALKTPTSVSSNVTFVLPGSDGSTNQALITNGNKQFGWSSILTPSDVGTVVQAYDVELDAWSEKVAPTGDVVGDSDVQVLTNKILTTPTITNPTVTNYTETISESTGNTSINLANGTVFKVFTNSNVSVTIPQSVSGKSFIVVIAYGGDHSVSWLGGSSIKWAGGIEPTPTSINGKSDIFTFFQDGVNTYASVFGSNF